MSPSTSCGHAAASGGSIGRAENVKQCHKLHRNGANLSDAAGPLDTTPQHRVLSRQEVEEELKLRGLPTELLAVLRATPAPLDPGEIENPYDVEIIPPDTATSGDK